MIHQIQIKYDAAADRLLMQVRTRSGEIFAVWLTRRMMQRLWPPFQQLSAQMALTRAAPDAVLMPEARAMLADVARSRPLPNADFTQRFTSDSASLPLGKEPLLAAEIELQASAQRGVLMTIRESRDRHVALQINEELHAALLRLFEQALDAADWGLAAAAVNAGTGGDAPPLLS